MKPVGHEKVEIQEAICGKCGRPAPFEFVTRRYFYNPSFDNITVEGICRYCGADNYSRFYIDGRMADDQGRIIPRGKECYGEERRARWGNERFPKET